MIKKEKIIIPATQEKEEEREVRYCDRCGNKCYEGDNNLKIEIYKDSDIYKERKYKTYLGYDICDTCVEEYLIPLLQKQLKKEPNQYEYVYDFGDY